MKTTITVFALAINFSVFAQGIQFIEVLTDSDFMPIEKRATEENKLIFIDCYTTWCGSCKWMSKEIFPNDTAGKFFNKHFINVKMDMGNGIGLSARNKYEVNAFPTFLFVSSETVVHRAVGERGVKELIELGETAHNPEKRFGFWQKKYDSGNRKPEEIH